MVSLGGATVCDSSSFTPYFLVLVSYALPAPCLRLAGVCSCVRACVRLTMCASHVFSCACSLHGHVYMCYMHEFCDEVLGDGHGFYGEGNLVGYLRGTPTAQVATVFLLPVC